MKLYHKAFLYQNKWIQPYVRLSLGLANTVTYLAAFALIAGVIYEHGFPITQTILKQLNLLYDIVWIIFLTTTTTHILLDYKEVKRKYRSLMWVLNMLLFLTLIPKLFFEPEPGAVRYVWTFLNGKMYQITILLILSILHISNGIVRLLGRRTNPSLILAFSFLVIISIGTGLLLLPLSTFNDISWVDAVFTATSAVCVTGLTSVDVSSTFTTMGLTIIILLIQIGGLGVMTFTSFFAMFFMGNTSLYNKLAVRDMVSSDSLSSLLSTLLYILGFTLVIEGIGMLVLLFSIHGTMGMTFNEELAFSAFHSISAFCNAGFSTLPGNMGNPLVMNNHNLLYITLSFLIIFGGIGFPILVNFKAIAVYHLKRFWRFICSGKIEPHRIRHLYNLNTKIVLLTTFLLLLIGTGAIALFEWNNAFAGMTSMDKMVQAFFNATCPRTAGFNSVGMTTFSMQTILLMILLMFIGGASQSTAGGIKVNTFAVILLNLWAVLRGSKRVEVFQRELSLDSIRRSNATVLMYLLLLFMGVFALSILEPHTPLVNLIFECTSALSTVGSSLDTTPLLGVPSKLIVAFLMFVGRVGVITLMLGLVRQKRITKYEYPKDNIIIN
ncbi:MAG: potassium transporter TrkG [Bacteroides sp.]